MIGCHEVWLKVLRRVVDHEAGAEGAPAGGDDGDGIDLRLPGVCDGAGHVDVARSRPRSGPSFGSHFAELSIADVDGTEDQVQGRNLFGGECDFHDDVIGIERRRPKLAMRRIVRGGEGADGHLSIGSAEDQFTAFGHDESREAQVHRASVLAVDIKGPATPSVGHIRPDAGVLWCHLYGIGNRESRRQALDGAKVIFLVDRGEVDRSHLHLTHGLGLSIRVALVVLIHYLRK